MARPKLEILSEQRAFFDPRFIQNHAGPVVRNPVVALIELIANSWDAGATEVKINWPTSEKPIFSLSDNGCGMTFQELNKRWQWVYYNRVENQGEDVIFPPGVNFPIRPSFGRNGIGRYAAFFFSPRSFLVITKTPEEDEIVCRVSPGKESPLKIDLVDSKPKENADRLHGTTIQAEQILDGTILSESNIRAEIGTRFLADPGFQVYVNGVKVKFDDIPTDGLIREEVEISDFGSISLLMIDAKATDRTSKQHGIAWRVKGRLVGRCDWEHIKQRGTIDRRTVEAHRYTFIVLADLLEDAVLTNWTGFDEENENWPKARECVLSRIEERLFDAIKDRRRQIRDDVFQKHHQEVKTLSPLNRQIWKEFVNKIIAECPSLNENQIDQIAGILAKLEQSRYKYDLIGKLAELETSGLDNLTEILRMWDIEVAKTVLDELYGRLNLIKRLEKKVFDSEADEVKELQPLFKEGLWIFGPEFDTIEYTSNQRMNTVIRDLFGKEDIEGSWNRPDFVILPDNSTIGFHSYPNYDEEGGEDGVASVVVIELKTAKIKIGSDELSQAGKYIRELLERGIIQPRKTKVRSFVLGAQVDPIGGMEMSLGENIQIKPLEYSSVLSRAHSRTFNLLEKIKEESNIEQNELDEFLDEDIVPQTELALMDAARN